MFLEPGKVVGSCSLAVHFPETEGFQQRISGLLCEIIGTFWMAEEIWVPKFCSVLWRSQDLEFGNQRSETRFGMVLLAMCCWRCECNWCQKGGQGLFQMFVLPLESW